MDKGILGVTVLAGNNGENLVESFIACRCVVEELGDGFGENAVARNRAEEIRGVEGLAGVEKEGETDGIERIMPASLRNFSDFLEKARKLVRFYESIYSGSRKTVGNRYRDR